MPPTALAATASAECVAGISPVVQALAAEAMTVDVLKVRLIDRSVPVGPHRILRAQELAGLLARHLYTAHGRAYEVQMLNTLHLLAEPGIALDSGRNYILLLDDQSLTSADAPPCVGQMLRDAITALRHLGDGKTKIILLAPENADLSRRAGRILRHGLTDVHVRDVLGAWDSTSAG